MRHTVSLKGEKQTTGIKLNISLKMSLICCLVVVTSVGPLSTLSVFVNSVKTSTELHNIMSDLLKNIAVSPFPLYQPPTDRSHLRFIFPIEQV